MNNYYVVNSAVYNNVRNPDAVDSEVRKILQKSTEIAGQDRKVVVVIGLNAPNDQSVSDAQMDSAVKRIQDIAAGFQGERVEVKVIHYRWERFDERLKPKEYKANERINYVAIRNNLFYSKENSEAVQKMITEAKTQENASVKLLALDGDTDISSDSVQKLEKFWNDETTATSKSVHLPPLVTSTYYEFEFEQENVELVGANGELNWGMHLAFLENAVDVESKQLMGAEKIESHILYRKLSLPDNDDKMTPEYILQRTAKFQKNLFVLDRISTEHVYPQNKVDELKIHFCDILSLVDAYKEAIQDKSPEGKLAASVFRERLVSSLREIEKIENELDDIEKIKYDFSVSGKQILYPSENVMFVSLYDKVHNKEFNLFEDMVSVSQASSQKTRKLWGNDVGREEGENIASQMRKFWQTHRTKDTTLFESPGKKPKDFASLPIEEQRAWSQRKAIHKAQQVHLRERELIAFPHTVKTGLPPRAHKFLTSEQQEIGKSFPQRFEELQKVTSNPKQLNELVDRCAALVATRSQTSLSNKFLSQRLRFIRGQHSPNVDLKDPTKKLSLFTRAVREAIASSFEGYFQNFYAERLGVLKQRIRQSILDTVERGNVRDSTQS